MSIKGTKREKSILKLDLVNIRIMIWIWIQRIMQIEKSSPPINEINEGESSVRTGRARAASLEGKIKRAPTQW